ncbi:FAD-binding oxidoreductase [Curtobacterium sp. L1-20]|uniref:FAD-binding oxidoreductase n=1 Tax=Curtobacterium sp. L1-20 TaxID=3138181 RepID=UPI003B51B163
MSHTLPDDTVDHGARAAFREAVAGLDASLEGVALTPEDAGYPEACAGYNLAGRRHPDVVVTAHSASDVVEAVTFAAAHDLPVAVVATGHHAMRPLEGGLLVSTAAMDDVHVDADARRAVVGAGARWSDVVPRTAEHHLTPVHGSSGQVGAVGFTLGGGLSPVLGRKYGWGSDHIVSLDVVTASGEVVRASAEDHADLFWALRGGRSNLGIVTSMEIELFPVDRFVGGGLFYDGEHAEAVLSAFVAATATAPDDLTLSLAFLRLPPVPGVPPLLAGRFVLHLRVAYLGDAAGADDLLAPLRAAAPVIVDTVEETRAVDFERIHNDPTDPAPFSEETSMLAGVGPDAQRALLELVGPTSDTGLHIVELRQLGGAFDVTRPGAGAIVAPEAAYVLWALSIGMPEEDADGIAQARALVEAVRPWSTGSRYLNFAPDDGHPERSFTPTDWSRLLHVKAAVDPRNLFRTQQPLIES